MRLAGCFSFSLYSEKNITTVFIIIKLISVNRDQPVHCTNSAQLRLCSAWLSLSRSNSKREGDSNCILHISSCYVMVRQHTKNSFLGCLEVTHKFVWWLLVMGGG